MRAVNKRAGAVAAAAAALVALIAALLVGPALGAGAPGTPATCAASAEGDGYRITWSPIAADPAVNWYSIRKKGDTTPTAKSGDTSFLWTAGTAGASAPLTFMVAAHSPAGRSDWCEAVVGDDPEPTETPSPTDSPSPSESPTQSPSPTDPPTTDPPGDDAAKVGIRVFPHYAGKTYGNHAEVLEILGRLGVQRISALLTPSMSGDEIAFYQQAHAQHGIKVWFAVGRPGDVLTDAEWGKVRDLLTGPLAGMVELVSGWNEPNHRVAGDWTVPTAAHQRQLWANVAQVNVESGQDIKVGTPPLWSGNVNEQYADLAQLAPKIIGFYDTINWHLYPHGNTGPALEEMIDRQVAEFTAAYGQHPMVNSESGYSTSVGSGQGNPVTEAQQAELIDDLILFHLERGIAISDFELLDDPDPGGTNREAHFGLIDTPSVDPSTWRDKPAFAVFRDLVLAS